MKKILKVPDYEENDIVKLSVQEQEKEFLTENSESEEEGEVILVKSKVVPINSNTSATVTTTETNQVHENLDTTVYGGVPSYEQVETNPNREQFVTAPPPVPDQTFQQRYREEIDEIDSY